MLRARRIDKFHFALMWFDGSTRVNKLIDKEMTMKRNVTVSIAAGLMLAAALVQANDVLVAGEFAAENMIVEAPGATAPGGGSFADDGWVKDEYPFPVHYGPID
jgi:hypothetical protein